LYGFSAVCVNSSVVGNTRLADRNSIAYERRLTGIDFKAIYRTGNSPPAATKYKSTDDGDTSRVFITSIKECNEEVLGIVGNRLHQLCTGLYNLIPQASTIVAPRATRRVRTAPSWWL